MRNLRKVVALVLICMFAMSTTAFASPKFTEKDMNQAEIYKQKTAEMDSAIQILEPYVSRNNDGTFSLNAPEKIVKQINSDLFKNINEGIKTVNKKISEGDLVSDSNLRVYPKHSNFSTQELNGLYFYWWGWRVYIDHHNTNVIAAGLAAGAGASWVAAELVALGIITSPGSIPLGLVAAILATGSGTLLFMDSFYGHGIYFQCLWNGIPSLGIQTS